MVHERGSGLVGRGGKIGSIGGSGRVLSSSSESESEEDNDSSEEVKRHHKQEELNTSMSTTRVELLRMLREKERMIRKL